MTESTTDYLKMFQTGNINKRIAHCNGKLYVL